MLYAVDSVHRTLYLWLPMKTTVNWLEIGGYLTPIECIHMQGRFIENPSLDDV